MKIPQIKEYPNLSLITTERMKYTDEIVKLDYDISNNFLMENTGKKVISEIIKYINKNPLPTNINIFCRRGNNDEGGLVCEIYSYGFYNIGDIKIVFTSNPYTLIIEKFKIGEIKLPPIKLSKMELFLRINDFFYNQQENKFYLTNLVKDILNLFSYTGGWEIYTKKFGVRKVIYFKINSNIFRMKKKKTYVFTYMKPIISNNKKYNIFILNPNKFINSKKKKEEYIKKYTHINSPTLNLVKTKEIFVICLCGEDEFVKKTSSISKEVIRIFKRIYKCANNFFMINWSEGEYLKGMGYNTKFISTSSKGKKHDEDITNIYNLLLPIFRSYFLLETQEKSERITKNRPPHTLNIPPIKNHMFPPCLSLF